MRCVDRLSRQPQLDVRLELVDSNLNSPLGHPFGILRHRVNASTRQQAIRSARDNGFVQNEGVAHELAAGFYLGRGSTTAARAHLEGRAQFSPRGCDLAHAARRACVGGGRLSGHVCRGVAGNLWAPSPRLPARRSKCHCTGFRWLNRWLALKMLGKEAKSLMISWSEWQDLNLRPLRPERK